MRRILMRLVIIEPCENENFFLFNTYIPTINFCILVPQCTKDSFIFRKTFGTI